MGRYDAPSAGPEPVDRKAMRLDMDRIDRRPIQRVRPVPLNVLRADRSGSAGVSCGGGSATGGLVEAGPMHDHGNRDGADVAVKDGVTRRAAVSGVLAAAAAPYMNAGQAEVGTMARTSNFYPSAVHGGFSKAVAAGESGTPVGGIFSVDDAAGNLIYFNRTAQGSAELTRTMVASGGSAIDGAGQPAFQRDASSYRALQDSINRRAPPHLLDKVPGTLHADILAGSGNHDITEFLNQARALAIAEGYDVVQLPPGSAVVSDTVFLDNEGSFLGCAFVGPGQENFVLKQAFSAAHREKPVFKMRGGSGSHSNKGLFGLTVKPVDKDHAGRGKGLQIDGNCILRGGEFVMERLHTGIEITNSQPGAFTEFCELRNFRSLDCLRGVSIIRSGGNDSFHGTKLYGIINVPLAGVGLYIRGISGPVYWYNTELGLHMFGDVGSAKFDRYAIDIDGGTLANVSGWIKCESPLKLKSANGGSFHMAGSLTSISGLDASEAENPGDFLFNDFRNSDNFAAGAISAYVPGPLPQNLADRNDNGDFPVVFAMTRPNGADIGSSVYRFQGASHWRGTVGFGKKLEDFAPGWREFADGSQLRSFSASVEHRDSSDTAGQLVLAGGRVGGNIGRKTSYALARNTHIQTITMLRNADNTSISLVYVRIAGRDYEHRTFNVLNHQGFGGDGHLEQIAKLWELPVDGVDFGGLACNPLGDLVLTIKTDRPLTVCVAEFSLGTTMV